MRRRRLIRAALCAVAASAAAACTPAGGSAQETTQSRGELAALYDQIGANATGFTVGRAPTGKTVHVFFDPQCTYCAQLWRQSKDHWEHARFTWIPVARLRPVSLGQGATILAGTTPAEVMDEHEALMSAGGSGIAADAAAVSKYGQAIGLNTELHQVMKGDTVPFILYRSPSGTVHTAIGALTHEQIGALLARP